MYVDEPYSATYAFGNRFYSSASAGDVRTLPLCVC